MRWVPLLLLVGCAPRGGLTIVNPGSGEWRISGLQGQSVVVGPASQALVEAASTRLVARSTSSAEMREATIAAPPAGGHAIWVLEGEACFLEGDFTEYYSAPPDVPAQARLLGKLGPGESVYVSHGAIAATPGQRLPKDRRGDAVVALLQVPCAATVNDGIATAWLEVALRDLEPPE